MLTFQSHLLFYHKFQAILMTWSREYCDVSGSVLMEGEPEAVKYAGQLLKPQEG